MRDLFQNFFRLLCPDKGLGIFVVHADEVLDGRHQLGNAPENTATDALAGDFAEPTLHQIQPRRARGREVQVVFTVSTFGTDEAPGGGESG